MFLKEVLVLFLSSSLCQRLLSICLFCYLPAGKRNSRDNQNAVEDGEKYILCSSQNLSLYGQLCNWAFLLGYCLWVTWFLNRGWHISLKENIWCTLANRASYGTTSRQVIVNEASTKTSEQWLLTQGTAFVQLSEILISALALLLI